MASPFRATGLKASIARAVRCKVSGQNVNGVIEGKIEGDTITALMTVRTKGNRQTFVMDSPGAWISHVSIDLVRDSR